MPSASRSQQHSQQAAQVGARVPPTDRPPSLVGECLCPIPGESAESGHQAGQRQEQPPHPSPAINYTASLRLFSYLPGVVRRLYWKMLGVPERERLVSALDVAGLDHPARICRAFSLRDPENIGQLLTHQRVLGKHPSAALGACISEGISDPEVIMRCARAVLACADSKSHRRLHEVMGHLPIGEEQRTELAMLAAERHPFELAKRLKNYDLRGLENRREVSRAILHNDTDGRPGRSCLVVLELRKHFDCETRVDLGMTLACRNPYVLARDFKALGVIGSNTSERASRDCRRLAFAAAGAAGPVHLDDCRRTIAAHIGNFGIKDQNDLTKLAMLCASVSGGDTARHIDCFGLQGESDRFAVALQAASSRNGSSVFVAQIAKFRVIDPEMLRAIGTRHAQSFGWQCSDFIESFGFRTREQKRELALATADAFGLPSQDSPAYPEIALGAVDRAGQYRSYLARYGFESLKEVVKLLFSRAVLGRPITAVRALPELGDSLEDQYDLLEIILRATPDGLREIRQNVPDEFWSPPTAEPGALSDQKKAPVALEALLAGLVVPALNSILREWYETRRPELMRDVQNVFNGIINVRESIGMPIPESALREGRLEAMLYVLKYIEENRKLNLRRPKTQWDLFEVGIAGAAQQLAFAAYFLTGPLFCARVGDSVVREGIKAAFGLPELPVHELEEDQLARLYETFTSAGSTRGLRLEYNLSISADVWRNSFSAALDLVTAASVIAKLRGSSAARGRIDVSVKTLQAVTERLISEVQQEFGKQFALECGSGIMELQKEWGDLSPLTALLARFKGGHTQELPVLRDVVRNVLAGTFYDWKYCASHGQLRSMGARQIEAWRKNPQRARLVSALDASKLSAEDQLADARGIFDQDLLRHIPEPYVARRLVFQPAIQDVLRRSELGEREFSRESGSLLSVTRDVEVLLAYGEHSALEAYLKRFNSAKRGIQSEMPEAPSAQVLKDLGGILNAVRHRSVDAARRYLMFTCITDHPKLLITIGDLVKASSCQSYKSGGMVETLPGYVIDSNIKVLLSFVVAEGKLRSSLGFARRVPLHVENWQVDFVPTRLSLNLRTGDGRQAEIDLGMAISRRILRVGIRLSDERALVMPEPRYQQQHAVTSLIDVEQDLLLAEFTKMCGFAPCEGMLDFPKTRNPCGVYSDLGEGVQLGPYRIWYKRRGKR